MMFPKYFFQSKNMFKIVPISSHPTIKIRCFFRLGSFHKTPLGWIPLAIFEVVATQISVFFHPRKLGFHDPIWRTRIFLRWGWNSTTNYLFLGRIQTWGPCELHPRWCGLGKNFDPKKHATSSASRSPRSTRRGSRTCFLGWILLGIFFVNEITVDGNQNSGDHLHLRCFHKTRGIFMGFQLPFRQLVMIAGFLVAI